MTTRQGSLSLLDDPVAQHLLQSPIPARLAYVWTDGAPRVIPINFHWNGKEVVLGTPPDAPKMQALRNGTKVALTIDTETMPWKVLLIRGSVQTDVVNGIVPEYEALTIKCLGEEAGQAWLATMRPMVKEMVRVAITPEWVGILDFETRFPSALERDMERAQAEV